MFYFEFCFSVHTCEISCFTYCIRKGIVSRDCVRLTDVSVIDMIRSYENRENVWGGLPVRSEGQFSREFTTICNHCGDDGLMSQDLEILSNFCFFSLKNDPLW